MHETDTPTNVGSNDQLGHADETHHLPTPEDLRSYADDADQHGNRWVPIAPTSLRGIAGEVERLRAMLAKARAGLSGGLWDYGPGQDEHDQCNTLVAEIDAALGPNVKLTGTL